MPLLDAGLALARGEPLAALSIVGRVTSADGLILRGIAYAQLGDLELARDVLERALRATDDPLRRARARAALVEIDLDEGEPSAVVRSARACAEELERLGDLRNAALQRLVVGRAEVLLGRLAEARHVVDHVLQMPLPPDVRAIACLALAEVALRSVATNDARAALARARRELAAAPNHALDRALATLEAELSRPVARLSRGGVTEEVDLFAVEAASRGDVLLVDACRRIVVGGRVTISLARRPVLFLLLLLLARAWPRPVSRDELARSAFGARRLDESHRLRLRVEVGRLRKAMGGLAAGPVAAGDGYALASTRDVTILLPPSDDEAARIGILLGDGAAWSARGLAEHAGVSKSTAQRALNALVESGGAVRTARGKDVRYTRPGTPIASRMLLLGLVPKP